VAPSLDTSVLPDFDYGDKELHACDADSSVVDHMRPVDEDQGYAMRRSQASALVDHSHSDDTPSTDPFVQTAEPHALRRKLNVDADEHGPVFEYGDNESGRGCVDSSVVGPLSHDDEDQGFAMRRSQASAKADHFTCEETPSTDPSVQIAESHASMRKLTMDAIDAPSPDTFVLVARKSRPMPLDVGEDGPDFAYGDKGFPACDADRADAGPMSPGDEDQGIAVRRPQASVRVDRFSNEATPSTDPFVLFAEPHASRRELTMDADEHGPEFEYGDNEFGRDGRRSFDGDDQGCARRRSLAPAKDDHFNGEESPSIGIFVQLDSSAVGPFEP